MHFVSLAELGSVYSGSLGSPIFYSEEPHSMTGL
jgi:hypothetical protein